MQLVLVGWGSVIGSSEVNVRGAGGLGYWMSSMVPRREKVQAVLSLSSVGISERSSYPRKYRENRIEEKSIF